MEAVICSPVRLTPDRVDERWEKGGGRRGSDVEVPPSDANAVSSSTSTYLGPVAPPPTPRLPPLDERLVAPPGSHQLAGGASTRGQPGARPGNTPALPTPFIPWVHELPRRDHAAGPAVPAPILPPSAPYLSHLQAFLPVNDGALHLAPRGPVPYRGPPRGPNALVPAGLAWVPPPRHALEGSFTVVASSSASAGAPMDTDARPDGDAGDSQDSASQPAMSQSLSIDLQGVSYNQTSGSPGEPERARGSTTMPMARPRLPQIARPPMVPLAASLYVPEKPTVNVVSPLTRPPVTSAVPSSTGPHRAPVLPEPREPRAPQPGPNAGSGAAARPIVPTPPTPVNWAAWMALARPR